MHNRPGVGLAAPGGHLEGVDDEFGPDVIGDGPPDDAPAEHIEDGTAVDLAVPRRMLRDVDDPELVGSLGYELPLHEIVVDGRSGPSSALPAMTHALEIGTAHEPGHPLPPDASSPAKLEFGVDTGCPIVGPGRLVDGEDLVQEVGVDPVPLRRRTGQPVVVGRSGDLENPAGHRDVDAVTAQLLDQPERSFGRTFPRAK